MGKTAPNISRWALTLGGMIDFGGVVQVWCDRCRGSAEVDLTALAEKVGRDYSLVDRRCRCRLTPGCIGWNCFRYATGPHAIRWNLSTEAGIQRRIDRDYAARMALAAGVRQHRIDMEEKKRRERH